MPNVYSNLYQRAPNSNAAQFIYSGPHAERRGDVVLRFSTFTGTLPAVDDVLYIAGGFLFGEKVNRVTAIRSGDPDTDNDFTFNLGWRVGTAATPGSAFAAASTGLQAVAAFTLAPEAVLAAQAAAEGDDLILTRVAGELEAAATHTFLIESYIP